MLLYMLCATIHNLQSHPEKNCVEIRSIFVNGEEYIELTQIILSHLSYVVEYASNCMLSIRRPKKCPNTRLYTKISMN